MLSPPTSQLDRFRNMPPTSPIGMALDEPTPRPSRKAEPIAQSLPLPLPLSKHQLPRDMLNKSLDEGAVEARKVLADVINSPALNGSKAATVNVAAAGLTSELSDKCKDMTIEEYIRWEMAQRYAELASEGNQMIQAWEAHSKAARQRLEAL